MPKLGLITAAGLGFSALASWYLMSHQSETMVVAGPETAPAAVAREDVSVAPAPAQAASAAPAATVAASGPSNETAPENLEDPAIDPAIAARYDSTNPDYPTLAMRMMEMSARRAGQSFEPAAVVEAVSKDSAWETDASIADALPLTPEEQADGREFIRFDPLKVESLVAGDEMEVQIMQTNASYRMTVDRVQANDDGTVTWHGRLNDFATDNQVSFTRAKTLTYGGIYTPAGQFVLEARDDKGWIASGATLFKKHHHPIVPPDSALVTGPPSQ